MCCKAETKAETKIPKKGARRLVLMYHSDSPALSNLNVNMSLWKERSYVLEAASSLEFFR